MTSSLAHRNSVQPMKIKGRLKLPTSHLIPTVPGSLSNMWTTVRCQSLHSGQDPLLDVSKAERVSFEDCGVVTSSNRHLMMPLLLNSKFAPKTGPESCSRLAAHELIRTMLFLRAGVRAELPAGNLWIVSTLSLLFSLAPRSGGELRRR
jgi:hypothetical protein